LTPEIDVTVAFGTWRTAVAGVEQVCRRAAAEALAHSGRDTTQNEISVLLCDDDTMRELNREYRGRDGATNVLSFAIGRSGGGPESALLGDVAIAFETIAAEAAASRLAIADHLTHLVVHGVLHLLGYDHLSPREADSMEALEVEILDRLGVADPFAEEHAATA
jgi:probable rRNA maturation factor